MNKIFPYILIIGLIFAIIFLTIHKGIHKVQTVDFEKSVDKIHFMPTFNETDSSVIWSTRTITMVFEGKVVEINIGLHSNGTFVWKRKEQIGY